MLTGDLDYDLPAEAIAQTPIEPRDAARLLVDRGPRQPPEDRTIADLPERLAPGDVLVVNDTRVLPARLHLVKSTGGAVEVLLLSRLPAGGWEALVRPSRRVAPGSVLRPAPPASKSGADRAVADAEVEVGEVLGDDGRRRVDIRGAADDLAWLDQIGEVPLPPYIHEPLADVERYQTVFAAHPGSVAAPTAGLHLTDDVLDRCRARGVVIATVDLAVGLGTFRPITADRVEDHHMHEERYRIPPETIDAIGGADRVVAVGTTVVRALESWGATGRTEDATALFITPGFRWTTVDGLLTNFHVPRSSLLALVGAFVGERWRDLYDHALGRGYRFLSFGDAMLLERAA
jgi:S-adenosylmethionine:tRNA ribosyltransferase-isomerase